MDEQKIMDADKIYQELIASGEEWADKDAAANLLEETKPIVLAELMTSQPPNLSVAARECAARADPAFRLHVTHMVSARKESNRAKVRYAACNTLSELRRSQESTRRAELTLR